MIFSFTVSAKINIKDGLVLEIPKRIKELLESDQRYNSFVLSCISNVGEWLRDNKTVFFSRIYRAWFYTY